VLVRAELDAKTPMSATLFAKFVEIGRQHGVFALARGWAPRDKHEGTPGDESFEVFVDSVAPGLRQQAPSQVGNNKVRQGRWVAEQVDCPPPVADLYREILKALRSRGMAEP
jgi:hypothetical protein